MINQELISELFLSKGIVVELASSGEKALELLMVKTFDVVLMDIQMPGMNGLEATKKIRTMERLKGLPIIALTANVMIGSKDEAINSGMNDYIAKPIVPTDMFTTIAKYLTH